MSKPINLMASLKKVGKDGKTAIQIESDDLIFDPDDKGLASAIANAMVVQIREHLLRGHGPGGEALPPLKQSAIRSREYEERQGNRGGQAHERYIDNVFRHEVLNNYVRDYVAPRLGRFTPHEGMPRGNLSGMLAASFSARPNRDGKGVTIFVASKRGLPRPPGRKGRPQDHTTALDNVYAGVPLWTPQASRTPDMRKSMMKALKSIFGKKITGLGKATQMLARQLAATAETIQEASEEEI